MQQIGANSFVTFEYTLRDEDGDVLEGSSLEGGEPMQYVHGYAMIPLGLEAALEGLKVGDKKEVVLSPVDGFGEYDDELVFGVERSEFPNPDEVEVGDEVIAESDDPDEPDIAMRVVSIDGDHVVVDTNHPFAGMTLTYEVKIREVRPATLEEIAKAAEEFELTRAELEQPEPVSPSTPDVGIFGLVRDKGKSN